MAGPEFVVRVSKSHEPAGGRRPHEQRRRDGTFTRDDLERTENDSAVAVGEEERSPPRSAYAQTYGQDKRGTTPVVVATGIRKRVFFRTGPVADVLQYVLHFRSLFSLVHHHSAGKISVFRFYHTKSANVLIVDNYSLITY